MNERWNTQNRKGYPKIHVAVNIKTKEILALEGGNRRESTFNSKLLKKLVNHVLNDHDIEKKKSVLTDGPYIKIPISYTSKRTRSLLQ